MNPLLTIAIPTVIGREKPFGELCAFIQEQIAKCGLESEVEVFSICDNKEISIGAKRQRMLEESSGKYIIMVDDDDWLADNYVQEIYSALLSEPDAIGHKILCTFNYTNPMIESASNQWEAWADGKDARRHGFHFLRTTYAKTPMRRDIALEIGYKNIRYGEDHDFSKRLKEAGLIKTEVYLDKFFYFYRYVESDFNKKYGIKEL